MEMIFASIGRLNTSAKGFKETPLNLQNTFNVMIIRHIILLEMTNCCSDDRDIILSDYYK
jgi:hypothetical protein